MNRIFARRQLQNSKSAVEAASGIKLLGNITVGRDQHGLDLGTAARIANLRNGGGLNGANVLNPTTLADDLEADELYGDVGFPVGTGGRDWFLVGVGDLIGDLNQPVQDYVTTL